MIGAIPAHDGEGLRLALWVVCPRMCESSCHARTAYAEHQQLDLTQGLVFEQVQCSEHELRDRRLLQREV